MGADSRPDSFTQRFFAQVDLQRAQEAAEQSATLRQQVADAEATRYLAEMACPDDVTAFGERHGIPTFAGFTWQAGFMAGWRAAQTRKADGRPDERGVRPTEATG